VHRSSPVVAFAERLEEGGRLARPEGHGEGVPRIEQSRRRVRAQAPRHSRTLSAAQGRVCFRSGRFFFLASGLGGFLTSLLQVSPLQRTSAFSFLSRYFRGGK
jgi:hypothetical protein